MSLRDTPYKALRGPLPDDWDILVGADTGTYMSAVFVGIPPGDSPMAAVLADFPNYRYVGHEIELLGMSTPEWARQVYACWKYFRPGKETCSAWADPNTQFRAELQHYGIHLRPNFRGPELRVEIAREYMMAKDPERVSFAPWLQVLPYEIEHAKWPEDTTSAGKFMRLKHHDHTLDGFEHCLSRRPRGKHILREEQKSFLDQYLDANRIPTPKVRDPHLGAL